MRCFLTGDGCRIGLKIRVLVSSSVLTGTKIDVEAKLIK